MSKKDTDLGVVIGIDFGTTNSCVAVCKNKKVEIIANESGNRTTPSYVAYTSEGQRLIGEPAKDQSFRNPKNTIYNVKRLLGCNCNDEFVQKLIKNYPFEVIQKNSRFYFKIETGKGIKFFSVEEISAMVLKRLVRVAQEYLNEKIKNVVISVPAYFNDSQRQATKNAGTIAGLNVLRIINEPTAAAMAYGFHTLKHDGTILVFDFGGGTLDVTILKIKHKTFTVLSTSGNGHLGGEDFDQNVINHFIKVYEDKKRKNIRNDKRAVLRLKREVEKAKRALTFSASTRIEIDCFVREEDFSETLTRDKFEEINKNLFGEILKPIEQALKDAGLTISDIDEIIMVGGSSRIPKVRQMVKDFFNGKEPFQRINAEEAIAYGAAIQAGILSGQQDSIILFDVTPISLGVELGTKELMKFIPRNTIIPTKKTQIMTTYKDYQTEILFAVYEGESPNATDNLLLGKFILADIPPKPQSVAQIEVIFEIDDNGILQVSAKDLETNKMEKIIIRYEENRPTFEEMKIMIKDDNEYEDKIDQAIRKRMEFTDLLHSTKSSICDNKKLTNFQKKKMEIIIQENIKWLQDNASYEPKIYIQRRKKFEQTIKSIQNQ